MFTVTWIRQPLGTTPECRSCSRLRPSIPSPTLRSTRTPSATQQPPRKHKTASTLSQVSFSVHPLFIHQPRTPPWSQRPASLESTELLDRVQPHSLQSHSLCLPRMSLFVHLNSFVGCYHTCTLAKPCDENDSRYI